VGQFSEPHERVRQARAFLDFLNDATGGQDSAYARLLRDEAALLKGANDAYVYHEHLEAANQPVTFHEFAERAAGHGLQYLSEAYLDALPPALAFWDETVLGPAPDPLRQEQYVDFVLNRTFRLSLLCHAAVKLQRPPVMECVLAMHVHGLAQPETAQPDVASPAVERFRTEDGVVLTTGIPLYKAALLTLWEALPRALPFETLWTRVSARLPQSPALLENGRAQLAEHVLQGYLSSLLDLHLHTPVLATEVSARPVASPLARLQASGDEAITNVWHRYVRPSPVYRLLLRSLDGSRDAEALAETLTGLVLDGQLALQHQGRPMQDPEMVRHACRTSLGAFLQWLARNALLVG
jgi:methyltransferase-like protein